MTAGQGVSAGGVRQSPDGSRTGVGEPVRAAALGLKAQVSACCGSERAAASGTSQEVISQRRWGRKVVPSRGFHQLLPDCGPRRWTNRQQQRGAGKHP